MIKVLTYMKNKYINIKGFHTKRQLLVIESDDWGSIRMPSSDILKELQLKGDYPERDAFLRNDSLETEEDLENLFEVLNSIRDKNGNPAIITANFVMANPNFEKINYKENIYEYEKFYETYEKYFPKNKIIEIIKKGIKNGYFYPQLHCREHLNINRWMNDLNKRKEDVVLAFENKMIGIGKSFSEENRFGYMDAFNENYLEKEEMKEIFEDASKIFEDIFGFKSSTFVASCFVWGKDLEKILKENGIYGIQSSAWQNFPEKKADKNKLKRILHYTGEKNELGQVYTVRNCSYEPAIYQNIDKCIEKCLNDIEEAFKYNKPAIINSHRLNYISSINPKNAEKNLEGLKKLLFQVKNKYTNIEFISSDKLLEIILKNEK